MTGKNKTLVVIQNYITIVMQFTFHIYTQRNFIYREETYIICTYRENIQIERGVLHYIYTLRNFIYDWRLTVYLLIEKLYIQSGDLHIFTHRETLYIERRGVRQNFIFLYFFGGGAVVCEGAAAPSALPSYALVYTYRNIMYREETY